MKPFIKDLSLRILEDMADLPYIGSMQVASLLYKTYGLPKKATDYKHLVFFFNF